MVGPYGYDRAMVSVQGHLCWRQRSQQQLKDRSLQWVGRKISPQCHRVLTLLFSEEERLGETHTVCYDVRIVQY